MCERNHSGLFFTCALVEQLGRDLKLKRRDVVKALGVNGVQMILGHADVFHCEPIEKVSDDMQQHFGLPHGQFDNVAAARYAVPDVWTIGKVYARLIEDVSGQDDVRKHWWPYIPRGSTKSSATITPHSTISPVTTSRNAIA